MTVKTETPKPRAKGAAPEREVVVLDGRAVRLKSSLDQAAQECENGLAALLFDEKQSEANMDDRQKSLLSKCLHEKGRQLAKLEGAVRGHISRINKSPNKSAFQSEVSRFESFLSQIRPRSALVSVMKNASPPADVWEQTMEDLRLYGVDLSAPYLLQDLAVKTQHALMFKDYAGLCKPYRSDAQEACSSITVHNSILVECDCISHC